MSDELENIIDSKYGVDLKFLDKEVSGSLRLQCDYSKIHKNLDWEPKIGFKEGLELTLDWFENELKQT